MVPSFEEIPVPKEENFNRKIFEIILGQEDLEKFWKLFLINRKTFSGFPINIFKKFWKTG